NGVAVIAKKHIAGSRGSCGRGSRATCWVPTQNKDNGHTMDTKKSNMELFEDPERLKSFFSRIRKFGGTLKLDVRPEFEKNPKAFRHGLVATLKSAFRGKPARRGNPAVRKAAEIYQEEYASLDHEGNWHEIAKRIYLDYMTLPVEL